jgi:hypothetical protein
VVAISHAITAATKLWKWCNADVVRSAAALLQPLNSVADAMRECQPYLTIDDTPSALSHYVLIFSRMNLATSKCFINLDGKS